jgi:hypothetical protein
MVPRRTLSLARMADFMSSVIWSLSVMVCSLVALRQKSLNAMTHEKSLLKRPQAGFFRGRQAAV